MADNPLTNLEETIREHWQKYLPKMSAELQAEGQLETSIQSAAQKTRDAMALQMSKGMQFWEAWEMIREQWAILPAEEDYDEDEEEMDGPTQP